MVIELLHSRRDQFEVKGTRITFKRRLDHDDDDDDRL